MSWHKRSICATQIPVHMRGLHLQITHVTYWKTFNNLRTLSLWPSYWCELKPSMSSHFVWNMKALCSRGNYNEKKNDYHFKKYSSKWLNISWMCMIWSFYEQACGQEDDNANANAGQQHTIHDYIGSLIGIYVKWAKKAFKLCQH